MLRIEANAWLMVASKVRKKAFSQNLEQRHFDRYTDYLLGEKCYNMQIPGCENHARKMRTFFTRRLEPKTKSSNAFKWSLRPRRK